MGLFKRKAKNPIQGSGDPKKVAKAAKAAGISPRTSPEPVMVRKVESRTEALGTGINSGRQSAPPFNTKQEFEAAVFEHIRGMQEDYKRRVAMGKSGKPQPAKKALPNAVAKKVGPVKKAEPAKKALPVPKPVAKKAAPNAPKDYRLG